MNVRSQARYKRDETYNAFDAQVDVLAVVRRPADDGGDGRVGGVAAAAAATVSCGP